MFIERLLLTDTNNLASCFWILNTCALHNFHISYVHTCYGIYLCLAFYNHLYELSNPTPILPLIMLYKVI